MGLTFYPDDTGLWTPYTPVLSDASSGTTLSSSAPDGRYMIVGKTCFCQGSISIGATATLGHSVSLPLLAKRRELNCGTLVCTGSGVPPAQSGIARMTTDQSRLVLIAWTNAFLGGPVGSSLQWNCTYELP